MKKPFIALLALVALAACESQEDKIAFDGVFFRAKATKLSKEQPDSFTVTVKSYSDSDKGARAAGSHEGIKYCIANYGTSNIEWSQGPDAETVTLDDDTLLLAGTCRP